MHLNAFCNEVSLRKLFTKTNLAISKFRKNRQIFLSMRLTALILIAAIHVHATGFSQISLSEKNAPLEKVFKSIEKQSGYVFFYDLVLLQQAKSVSIKVKNAQLDEVLIDCFRDQPLTYIIVGKTVVVKQKEELKINIPNPVEKPLNQNIPITGTVTDVATGKQLAGATVKLKTANTSTTTDENGSFTIQVPAFGSVLLISYVGYETMEVRISTAGPFKLTLKQKESVAEEVVVVGYGSQKKVNITGAVSVMNAAKIKGKTVTQASQVLAGELSGVTIRQSSGNPGKDNVAISIRGLGTFSGAGNNPLVVVDGIESSLDILNPSDIKSISVLKDAASASIYGSRAANGVIVIETKSGSKGKVRINYSSYLGKQSPTALPDFVDSWTYAQALNEAMVNMGASKRFSDADIQNFKSQSDPVKYPNVSHLKNLFSSGDGKQNKHDLNISGGTESSQYYFSIGHLKQGGLIKGNFNDRYDLRLNINSQISKNVNFNSVISGNITNREEPVGASNLANIITGAVRLNNTIPGILPDGFYGQLEIHHPEADINSGSFDNTKGSYVNNNTNLSWNIIPSLKVSAILGYFKANDKNKIFLPKYMVTPTYGYSPNQLSLKDMESASSTKQLLVNYDKQISKHLIHVLGGFSRQIFNSNLLQAYRDNLANNYLFELNAASPSNSTNAGTADENKLESYFGRLNYSFNEKYLFEANLRYDGSSRFSSKNRFGLFPSVSMGWKISNEEFFKRSFPFVNQLKFRGSWGKLGNQSIGNYPYQQLIALNQNMAYGGTLNAGAAVTTIANADITWETTRTTDIGFDLSLLNNRFSLTVDYFDKKTSDILYNVSSSYLLGAIPSVQNAGEVGNKGWDIDLSYKGKVGDFNYGISTNMSFVHNEVLKLANIQSDIANGLFVGKELGSMYGYVADGLFVDANDIMKSPTQPYSAKPGTIKFRDISGPNGVPDGIVSAAYDRKVIGSSIPNLLYGMRLSASYKGFDMFVLFQGEGGMERMMTRYELAFANNGNIQQWQWANRWTTENPNPNAKYPRLETGEAYLPNTTSTFWLNNASFMRLKNIELGYSIPSAIIDKFSLKSARIFISAQNILTLSKFQKGWDPEMSVGGSQYQTSTSNMGSNFYPPTKVISAGISVEL